MEQLFKQLQLDMHNRIQTIHQHLEENQTWLRESIDRTSFFEKKLDYATEFVNKFDIKFLTFEKRIDSLNQTVSMVLAKMCTIESEFERLHRHFEHIEKAFSTGNHQQTIFDSNMQTLNASFLKMREIQQEVLEHISTVDTTVQQLQHQVQLQGKYNLK
jgi:septal ring factor EnvC (AmiA/AmiB activator)